MLRSGFFIAYDPEGVEGEGREKILKRLEAKNVPNLNYEYSSVLVDNFLTVCKVLGGAPGAIRTPDLLIRSQMLYPAELRVQAFGQSQKRYIYIESPEKEQCKT